MKRLLTLMIVVLGLTASAQTYPKYNNEAGSSKSAVKPAKKQPSSVTPVVEDAAPEVKPQILKKKKTEKIEMVAVESSDRNSGDFQAIMERAVIQSKGHNYTAAISLYTQALDVATDDQAWRALVSRATTYQTMDKPDIDKAIRDLTTIIDAQNAPQKQLAYIYTCRGRLLQDKGDVAGGCADAKKARELGLPEALMAGLEKCI